MKPLIILASALLLWALIIGVAFLALRSTIVAVIAIAVAGGLAGRIIERSGR